MNTLFGNVDLLSFYILVGFMVIVTVFGFFILGVAVDGAMNGKSPRETFKTVFENEFE